MGEDQTRAWRTTQRGPAVAPPRADRSPTFNRKKGRASGWLTEGPDEAQVLRLVLAEVFFFEAELFLLFADSLTASASSFSFAAAATGS